MSPLSNHDIFFARKNDIFVKKWYICDNIRAGYRQGSPFGIEFVVVYHSSIIYYYILSLISIHYSLRFNYFEYIIHLEASRRLVAG